MDSARALGGFLVLALVGTAWLGVGAPNSVRLALAIGVGLPPLASLALLASPSRRRSGIALARGTAVGSLLVLAAVLSLFVVAFPFLSRPSPALLLLLVAHAGGLGSALSAAKRIERSGEGRVGMELTVASALYVPVALFASTVMLSSPRVAAPRSGSRPPDPVATNEVATNEYAASRAVHDVHRCAGAYAAAHEDAGYPSALKLIGPEGTGCLSAELAGGETSGYHVRYLPSLADASGRVRDFTICARPVRFETTGRETYVLDAAARERGSAPARPPAHTDSLTCAARWNTGVDYLNGIKHCVFEFAALHPESGYPDSLSAVGPRGSGCLNLPAGFAGDVLPPRCGETSCNRFVYLPGLPDASGRVRTFTLAVLGPYGRYTDESGVVRGTREERTPRPTDPPYEELLKTPSREPPARANRARLQRLCEAEHDLASCRRVAESLIAGAAEWPHENSDVSDKARADAAQILDHACAAGDGLSCLALPEALFRARWREKDAAALRAIQDQVCEWEAKGHLMTYCGLWRSRVADSARDPDPGRMIAAWERACRLGLGHGCWAAADQRLRSPGEPVERKVRPLLERGCSLGDHAACVALGHWLVRTGGSPARAAALFDAVCVGGADPAGCAALGLLYRDGLGVAKDEQRALFLLRRGCALAEDSDACRATAELRRTVGLARPGTGSGG